MVSNIGKITNLAATPSTGLVDGSDKLHSGILKVLESFSKGDMCVGHAGFTIGNSGGYTQYTLAQPIEFMSRGQYVNYTSADLTVAYSSTVQDTTHSRYDWVLLNPNIGGTPSIVIVQGTAAASPTVSDITTNYIPIALVHITSAASSDDDKTDYSFQTFTLDITKTSLSIMHGGVEAGNITGDADSIDIVSTITNADINITPNGSGKIVLDGLNWPTSDGSADQVLKTDGSGQLSFVAQSGGGGTITALNNQAANRLVTIGATTTELDGEANLTFDGNDLTIGTNLKLTTSSDNAIIENVTQDKDLIFKVNDGGSSTEVMRIDGDVARVGIGLDDPAGKLHVRTTDVDYAALFETTDDSASAAPDVALYRNSATPANGDDLGHLIWRGVEDAGGGSLVRGNYADIFAEIQVATSGSESGKLHLRTKKAGTMNKMISLTATEIVVNEDGNSGNKDINFRIESTGNDNMIFVDSGNDKVSIGNNSPSATLDVTGSIASDTSVTAPEVTGTAILTTNGQLYQTPEALDQSIPFPNMTGNQSIVYVGDISNPPTDPTNPGNSNLVELPDPNSCTHAVYTIRNVGTAAITVETLVGQIDGGSTDHAYVTTPNIIDLTPGQHITVQAVTDSVAPLVTGYYIIGN